MKRAVGTSLMLILVLSCNHSEEPEKYIPKSERKREKYATAEPGTYLKPGALSILKAVTRVMEDSSLVKEPSPRMVKMISARQKKQIDTVLFFNELEVPVRIYYPTKRSLQGNQPVTLFFHGGGFVLGSVDQYHMMVSKLARVTGQIVVSVDYRLAPEHPFPAAIKDCYAVLRWMQNNGSGLGADTTRITVMGDSAGGNICTVVTLMCRDQHTRQPFSQVLLYPGVTFLDTEYPSMTYFLRDPDRQYVLTEPFLKSVRSAYKGSNVNDLNPYISPLEATLSEDLAPALIITAECDPLRDSAREYAEKLAEAGVAVRYLEYSGMIHAFVSFHMILSDGLDAMKQIRDYLGEN
jgi:acetyl esterase